MNGYYSLSPYIYKCNLGEVIGGHDIGSRCVKMERVKLQKTDPTISGHNLNACKMTCGKYGALWPRPTGYVNLSEAVFDVFPDNIILEMHPKTMIDGPNEASARGRKYTTFFCHLIYHEVFRR